LNSFQFKPFSNNNYNTFRPIYYLGCKSSFSSIISQAIDELDPSGGRIIDLFSGTGAVGDFLKNKREVLSIDIQEYSRTICSAILNPNLISKEEISTIIKNTSIFTNENYHCFERLIKYEHECIQKASIGEVDPLIEILESPTLIIFIEGNEIIPESNFGDIVRHTINNLANFGLLDSKNTLITRYYGGLYFSYMQSLHLDNILSTVELYGANKRDTLMSAALSTASQIVNTVGKQFAQPIQPRSKSGKVKKGLVKTVQRDRSIDTLHAFKSWLFKYSSLPVSRKKHQILCLDFATALNQYGKSASVVYADPPYTRDHYSRFYHVLETMCLRDNPTISFVKKNGKKTFTRAIYREGRHQSDFCIRSAAPSAFETLFSLAKDNDLPLILSYSPHENGDGTHPRVVTLDKIIEIARMFYKHIALSEIQGVTHNQLNSRLLKLKPRTNSEILLKCHN
jgi:adenine-specific DNA-methyltransferase